MEIENNMEIKRIVAGAYQTNTYLVLTNCGVVVIDPSDDYNKIIEACNGKALEAVILTHGHFDHISSLQQMLDQYPNLIVYLHSNAMQKLKDPALNASYMTRKPFVINEGNHQMIIIDEGSVITTSDATVFHVMYTPGHTDCSVSVIVDNDMFVGDTIFKDYIGAYHFKTGDIANLRTSCYRLISSSTDYMVHPGHYESATVSEIRENNKEYQKLIKDLSI